MEDLGKGDYIQHKNNQQEDYRQTKIYAALQALGLAVETISCLEYSDMNGYILRLKKHSPLVSQVLEVYQQVISRYQIVGQVFKGNELLKLCHYLGFCTQLNITKETFLERLHQKCFSYPETVQNGSSFFSIAEIVGRGGNFSIELMDSSLLLWSKDANQMDKLVHEGLLLCIPQWFMEIVRRDLGEQQVAPKFARSALALH